MTKAASKPIDGDGRLLRVREVAEMLGCHPQSVFRGCLRRKNRIPHFKIPNAGLRFRRSDIERYIQDSRR